MVNAGGGCAWTATSDAYWLKITAGATGNGFGNVVVSADPNTGANPRTGGITVQGQMVTVTQPGTAAPPPTPTACTYPLSPATQQVAAGGGTASIMVNAGGGCAWTASLDVSWLHIVSGGGGTGFGYVVVSADPNTTGSSRGAAVAVQGQVVTVTQPSSTAPSSCPITVSTPALTIEKEGASESIAVSASPGCTWTATSNSSWLVITAQTGSGSGWVSYRVPTNTGETRVGTISLGSAAVVVAQEGTNSAAPPPTPGGIRIVRGR